MTIKQFTTAAKDPHDNVAAGDDQEIEVDGRTVKFYAPTSGQLGVAMATAAGYGTNMDRGAASINFFFSLMDEEDQNHFKGRLFDRNDPFDIDEISEITTFLMEDWSATPTKQPSDYAQSQSNGGHRSTHRPSKPARHRSPSDSTAS